MPRNINHSMVFTFRGIDKLSGAARNVRNSVNQIASASNTAAKQAQNGVAGINSGLANLVGSSTRAGRNVSGATSSMAAAGAQAARSQQGLAAMAGAYNALVVAKHVGRAIGAAVKPAMELEAEMAALQNATGATGGELEQLRKSALAAASITAFTPAETVEGLKLLRLATASSEGAIRSILPVSMLAQTFLGRDMRAAVTISGQAMHAFNIPAERLPKTLNEIVVAARLTGREIGTQASGYGKLGAAAARVAASFEEVNPAYVMLQRGGLTASEAGTGLNTVLGRLANPKHAAKLKANLDVLTTQGGMLRSLTDVIGDVYNKYVEFGPASDVFAKAMQETFGERGMKVMSVLMSQLGNGITDTTGKVLKGADALRFLTREMLRANQVLEEAGGVYMKTLDAQVTLLGQSVYNLAVAAFAPLGRALYYVVYLARGVVDFFTFLLNDIPYVSHFLKMFAATLGGIAMAGSGLYVVIAAVTGLKAVLAASWGWLLLNSKAMMWATSKMRIFTAWLWFSAHGAGVLGTALRGVGHAAKFMWMWLLRPLAIAIAGIAALTFILRKVWDIDAAGASKHQAQVDSLIAANAKTMADTRSVFDRLNNSLARLDSTVMKAAELEKLRMPVTPTAVLSQLKKYATEDIAGGTARAMKVHEYEVMTGRSGAISGGMLAGVEREKAAYTTYMDVINKARRGQNLDKDEVNKARDAITILTARMKVAYPEVETLQRAMGGLTKTLEDAVENSELLAKTGLWTGDIGRGGPEEAVKLMEGMAKGHNTVAAEAGKQDVALVKLEKRAADMRKKMAEYGGEEAALMRSQPEIWHSKPLAPRDITKSFKPYMYKDIGAKLGLQEHYVAATGAEVAARRKWLREQRDTAEWQAVEAAQEAERIRKARQDRQPLIERLAFGLRSFGLLPGGAPPAPIAAVGTGLSRNSPITDHTYATAKNTERIAKALEGDRTLNVDMKLPDGSSAKGTGTYRPGRGADVPLITQAGGFLRSILGTGGD